MDTQAIRKKILDLSLRGKLTEQLPEDGTADEILSEIQQVRILLEKTGRIKAISPMPNIQKEETPFVLPNGWAWERLINLYNFIDYRGATPNKIESGVPFVTAKNVRQGYIDYTIKEYISESDYNQRQSRGVSRKGDILFTTEAPMGYAAIADLETFSAGQRLITLQQYDGTNYLDNRFFMYCIAGQFFQQQLANKCSGTTVKGIKADRLKQFIVPVPPLSEQHRIVKMIDAIYSVLDTIDTLQSQYQDNLATLKSKIIDAGIQGKLTEQLPEDGTAEELYQQIQQEKLALEKAGKIKKAKPLPPISDEEKPFDIPDNWKWVSVGDVCTNIQYGTSKKSSETGKVPVIRMGNLQGGRIVYDKLAYTSDDSEIEKYPLEVNDLLFNRTNSMELVGKTAIYKGEMPAIYAGYLVRVTPVLMVSDYLNYVMQTKYYWDYCRMVRIDANGQSNINAEKLKRFVFPLPPLAEQKRIVAKLEELLPLCEGK